VRLDFRPGRLVLGLVFLLAAALYLADLAGGDSIPWWTVLPLAAGALLLAGAAGLLAYGVRRSRRRRADPADDPPPGRGPRGGGARARVAGAAVAEDGATAPGAEGVEGEVRGSGEEEREPGHEVDEVIAVVVRRGLPAHGEPQAQRDHRAAERGHASEDTEEGAEADEEFTDGEGVTEADGAVQGEVHEGRDARAPLHGPQEVSE
jgi:hypothetical protein